MSDFNPTEHLIDLKGKKYLEVKWRLVWFREEHPDWDIETQLISHDTASNVALFRARIADAEGKPRSTGYGSESVKDFRDYIEKAETKAIGRALAVLGYGTQFAPEMEEGERIVDAPVKPQNKAAERPQASTGTNTYNRVDTGGRERICEECGAALTSAQRDLSMKKFNRVLCPMCQPK